MQIQLQSSKSLLAVNSQFIVSTIDFPNTPATQSQSNKHPCDRPMPTTRLHDLPDDILISVFSSCDIDTILALRLTCTSFHAVIEAYITIIAPSSARNTFPDCDLLRAPPKTGYTVRWLQDLIPAQLASVVLDKDKLRRYPYINSGFPYGIPSENDCAEAAYWRRRITNGWRVLRSFHLISAKVYSSNDDKLKKPSVLRKVSGGVRVSRIWQAVSCPYAGCTEHGMKHLFEPKHRRDSHGSDDDEKRILKDSISEVQRKESLILRRRLARVRTLSDQDLLDYVYLWRLLLHMFRPYSKPGTTAGKSSSTPIPRPSWSTVISDIAQGCSWLNWAILHIGTAPFQEQWSLSATIHSGRDTTNSIRNRVWTAWNARTTHQIEIEREYASKFEFALRKRCLTSERLERLEAEISRGRSINTISLDCIPWGYDQHPRIPRSPTDFPWYKPGQQIHLDGEWSIRCAPGTAWSQPGILKRSLERTRSGSRNSGIDQLECDDDQEELGPLAKVPYLVYMGNDEAGRIWPGSQGDGAELAF